LSGVQKEGSLIQCIWKKYLELESTMWWELESNQLKLSHVAQRFIYVCTRGVTHVGDLEMPWETLVKLWRGWNEEYESCHLVVLAECNGKAWSLPQ
jgi:hypothetical protein